MYLKYKKKKKSYIFTFGHVHIQRTTYQNKVIG